MAATIIVPPIQSALIAAPPATPRCVPKPVLGVHVRFRHGPSLDRRSSAIPARTVRIPTSPEDSGHMCPGVQIAPDFRRIDVGLGGGADDVTRRTLAAPVRANNGALVILVRLRSSVRRVS